MLEKISTGIDIVDINRFRELPFSSNKKFYEKIFTISEIKYEIWEKIQKPYINNKFYELEYESLKSHPMWKDKSDRTNFKANQIK